MRMLLIRTITSLIVIHTCAGAARPSNAASPLGDTTPSPLNAKGARSESSPIRVAFQGAPGAYCEAALRELLGPNVVAVARPSFESCYRAVVSRDVDYAILPFENSLGGSIHENYDLMLRYDLAICAEHEFRVKHALLAKPGVKREDIKFVISHPQSFAQCENYLRAWGVTTLPVYDTAGSAKMIAEGGKGLPEGCSVDNTAAIASESAGRAYGLNCLDKGIEDDDSNFTRYLLVGLNGVVQYLSKRIPAKTSVVFTLPNTAGALYKALACFSLRDIDFSKIESRPTSANLLNYLKFRSQKKSGRRARTEASASLPRFRYCFYLDFLKSELDENAQNALHHLREQADFCRIIGSYPQRSRLIGPIHDTVEESKNMDVADRIETSLPSDEEDTTKMNVGIVGFGPLGRLLGMVLAQKHRVSCTDPEDKSTEADAAGVKYHSLFDMASFLSELDVIIVAVPLIEFEDTVASLPVDSLSGKLVVAAAPLCTHPKSVLTSNLGPDVDIICCHPMFGPSSSDKGGAPSLDGLPLVYEKVRISDLRRCDTFLSFFERARCQMAEMTAEQHDASTADADFVTHLMGRLLDRQIFQLSPIVSKEYAALCDVTDLTAGDTFDVFYGMFKYNERAKGYLNKLRENLAKLERQLAAKEAYLAAVAELRDKDRQLLLAECKLLLEEVARSSPVLERIDSSQQN